MSEARIRKNDEWRPASTKERLGMALHDTRKIHISLEILDILWSETDVLPDEISAPNDVREALGTIRDWLQQVEADELRGAFCSQAHARSHPDVRCGHCRNTASSRRTEQAQPSASR